ncbi:MAG: CoB--CoM heterodisulfide reductase iron-sulfur subunit A family protein [Candidatus Helarchaeota archaeon]|nr:CoB--CoM heterodisulfide reductase iron-sulfur subunit A family protein [Candidatus Helarchaeota archaeon]
MNLNKSVVVIGGGIAGLQAAIELADCGVNVHLLEKKASAGGNVQKLYKVFPTDDCAFCTVSTTLKPGIRKCFYRAGIAKHPRINLLTNCEVKNIEGNVGNFKVTITQHPRFVSFNCTRCGKCEDVCPVEISPNKWNEAPRKAIYLPAKMCIPQIYIVDRENCEPNCKKCEEVCPFEGIINLNEQIKELELNVDAIILATGYQEFDPTPLLNLKYGIYENIITQIELAQMLDPNGPTGGKMIRPSDGKPVQSLVMIQCVGSRDQTFKKYCSTICCSYACKHARIIKDERNSNINIHIIYMDIRTFGVLERYYRECRELGIDFLRGRIAEILQESDGMLRVVAIDTLLQRSIELLVDLVVLTPALIPNYEGTELINKIGIEIDEDGYIDSKIGDKTLTSVKGIYTCGTVIAPTDFPNSVTLAKSAIFNVIKQIYGGESGS